MVKEIAVNKWMIMIIALFGFTGQALAWGDREQGALAGAAGVLLLQHVFKDRQAQAGYPPVYPGQQPTVVLAPQQLPQVVITEGLRGRERVCWTVQVWDPSGRYYWGDQRVCSWQ